MKHEGIVSEDHHRRRMPASDPLETMGREQERPQESGPERRVPQAGILRGDFGETVLKRRVRPLHTILDFLVELGTYLVKLGFEKRQAARELRTGVVRALTLDVLPEQPLQGPRPQLFVRGGQYQPHARDQREDLHETVYWRKECVVVLVARVDSECAKADKYGCRIGGVTVLRGNGAGQCLPHAMDCKVLVLRCLLEVYMASLRLCVR